MLFVVCQLTKNISERIILVEGKLSTVSERIFSHSLVEARYINTSNRKMFSLLDQTKAEYLKSCEQFPEVYQFDTIFIPHFHFLKEIQMNTHVQNGPNPFQNYFNLENLFKSCFS